MSAKEKDNITPEEKLLKIIENPQSPAGKINLGSAQKASVKESLISRFRELHIDRDAVMEYVNIWTANKALAVLCIVLTAFWIFDFISVGFNLNKRLNTLVKTGGVSRSVNAATVFSGVEIREVLAQARKRNIFTLLPPKQEVIQTQALDQAVGNYKLVGIIWSDSPQAMIEDSKSGKTNLMSENEIMGDFKIKKIMRDKVIISKDKMEWELR